jgi:metal-sulfur cluster biosynthetic enzyme
MAAADEERALAEAALVRSTMTTTMPDCPATGYLKEGVANSTIEENAPATPSL